MQAERYAKSNDISIKIMPVPGQLSSECGMCIELDLTNVSKLKSVLNDKNIKFQYEQI